MEGSDQIHVYALGPIDFWSAWKPADAFLADAEKDVADARPTYEPILERAVAAIKSHPWFGQLRSDGGPWVCPLLDMWPEDGWPDIAVAMKIDMNGIVLLATPRRLEHLESLSSETVRVSN
jgi:hypothetical protein